MSSNETSILENDVDLIRSMGYKDYTVFIQSLFPKNPDVADAVLKAELDEIELGLLSKLHINKIMLNTTTFNTDIIVEKTRLVKELVASLVLSDKVRIVSEYEVK